MALYYYDKFTAIPNVTDDYAWQVVWGSDKETYEGTAAGSTSYSIDSTTGILRTTGEYINLDSVNGSTGTVYTCSGKEIWRWVATPGSLKIRETPGTSQYVKTGSYTSYSKGSLVQSKIAVEDGTYPVNGRHTDGYWYVKGAAVGPEPPGTITLNSNARISPVGSNKIARLDNGWLVAALKGTTNGMTISVSKDEGVTWQAETALGGTTSNITDVTICATGNEIAILIQNTSQLTFYRYDISSSKWTQNAITISSAVQAQGQGMDLFYDRTYNRLHMVYSTKTSISFNANYRQSTNLGASWTDAKQLTLDNASGNDNYNPTVVARGDNVYVSVRFVNGNNNSFYCYSSTNGGASFGGSNTIIPPSSYLATEGKLTIDKNGRLHLAYVCTESGDSAWHANTLWSDNGTTWNKPTTRIPLGNGMQTATITVDGNNNLYVLGYTIPNGGSILGYLSTDRGVTWSQTTKVLAQGYYPQALYDPEFRIKFSGNIDTPPPFIHEMSAAGVYFKGKLILNNAPTISITSPTDKQTLYENDVMNISGDAYDADKDQTVTVFYQINSEARKVLATNLSQTQIMLSKQLKFKAGKLYDGETAITGNLADGVAHNLKVWAVDSENASSAIVDKSFYVVPNRAPLLSVDTVVPSGVVDNDRFKISGNATDHDENSTLKVTRRINSGNSVEIYSGTGGEWEFEVALAQLNVGENVIVVEVIDNYGAKTSKTIKLNKNEVKTPILQSVARYKIEPPKGSAKGVLLFIERDKELHLKVELSMTLAGEQEQYETLIPADTAPMSYDDNIVEDTFYYETTEPKENIVLKLSTTRPDATVNHKIHLISGAVE